MLQDVREAWLFVDPCVDSHVDKQSVLRPCFPPLSRGRGRMMGPMLKGWLAATGQVGLGFNLRALTDDRTSQRSLAAFARRPYCRALRRPRTSWVAKATPRKRPNAAIVGTGASGGSASSDAMVRQRARTRVPVAHSRHPPSRHCTHRLHWMPHSGPALPSQGNATPTPRCTTCCAQKNWSAMSGHDTCAIPAASSRPTSRVSARTSTAAGEQATKNNKKRERMINITGSQAKASERHGGCALTHSPVVPAPP